MTLTNKAPFPVMVGTYAAKLTAARTIPIDAGNTTNAVQLDTSYTLASDVANFIEITSLGYTPTAASGTACVVALLWTPDNGTTMYVVAEANPASSTVTTTALTGQTTALVKSDGTAITESNPLRIKAGANVKLYSVSTVAQTGTMTATFKVY